MSDLKWLAARAGCWHGSNRLHDPYSGKPEDSASSAVLTPLLGGLFIRLDYDWSYRGARQEGSLLIGCQPDHGRMSVHWIDSWHMSHDVLGCTGAVEESGDVDVRGSYAVPPGPDWGWRIVIRLAEPAALHVVMHNVTPGGEEDVAVEATFTRAEVTD